MATNYKELEEYFESLATKHTYLKHTPTEKHFYRIDIEEYLLGVDSAIYPLASLERAEFNLSGPHNDNISKNRTVSLMIIDKFEADDHDEINKIYSETEEVGEEFIKRILYDVELGTLPKLLRDLKASSISLQHLPKNPIELTCGVRIVMELQSAFDKQVDTTKWSDL
jgi:hypothetical protein